MILLFPLINIGLNFQNTARFLFDNFRLKFLFLCVFDFCSIAVLPLHYAEQILPHSNHLFNTYLLLQHEHQLEIPRYSIFDVKCRSSVIPTWFLYKRNLLYRQVHTQSHFTICNFDIQKDFSLGFFIKLPTGYIPNNNT